MRRAQVPRGAPATVRAHARPVAGARDAKSILNFDDHATGRLLGPLAQVRVSGEGLAFLAFGVIDDAGVRVGGQSPNFVFKWVLCSKPRGVAHHRACHDWDFIMRATDLGVSTRPCREQDGLAVRRSAVRRTRPVDFARIGFSQTADVPSQGGVAL